MGATCNGWSERTSRRERVEVHQLTGVLKFRLVLTTCKKKTRYRCLYEFSLNGTGRTQDTLLPIWLKACYLHNLPTMSFKFCWNLWLCSTSIVNKNCVMFLCCFCNRKLLKELRHHSCLLKKLAKLFKITISNPFQSSPSSSILVPFFFRITPLEFFFLSKPLLVQNALLWWFDGLVC